MILFIKIYHIFQNGSLAVRSETPVDIPRKNMYNLCIVTLMSHIT